MALRALGSPPIASPRAAPNPRAAGERQRAKSAVRAARRDPTLPSVLEAAALGALGALAALDTACAAWAAPPPTPAQTAHARSLARALERGTTAPAIASEDLGRVRAPTSRPDANSSAGSTRGPQANELRNPPTTEGRGRMPMSSIEVERAGLVGLIANETSNARRGFCSSTLVDDRLLLTAAHCMRTPSGPVRFAAFADDIYGAQRVLVPITEIERHPSRDLALVLLSAPAPSAYHRIGVFTALSHPFTNEPTTGLGFGWVAFDQPESGGTAQRAEGIALSLQPEGPAVVFLSGARSGMCFGDSGGPLVASSRGERGVVGVLSAGHAECAGGDTYIPTSSFGDWITDTAEELGGRIRNLELS